MNILVVLVPVSLGLGAMWLAWFVWALRGDQFEDPEGDANRILFADDDAPRAAHHDAPRAAPHDAPKP